MPDTTTERPDWAIPAIVVGIAAVAVIVIGIVIGITAASNPDDSVAGQLERWSSCLRSHGSNVPLVETMRDGGFRITVDGSLIDEGLDRDSLRPALDACSGEAPEAIRSLLDLIGTFPELPFGGIGEQSLDLDNLPGADELDNAMGQWDQTMRDMDRLCEQLERRGVRVDEVHPRLRRACLRAG